MTRCPPALAQELHEAYAESFAEALSREEAARREAAAFHAQPLPPPRRPFEPHPSDAPITVPVEPKLETMERVPKRQKFDQTVAANMRRAEVRLWQLL